MPKQDSSRVILTAQTNEQAQATVFGELADRFSRFDDLAAIVTGRRDPGPGECSEPLGKRPSHRADIHLQ